MFSTTLGRASRRVAALAALCLTLTAAPAAGAGSALSGNRDPATQPPDRVTMRSATGPASPAGGDPTPVPEHVDPDAVAALTWSVPDRYEASWSAWNSVSGTYDRDFVTPKRWSIKLDACASRAVRRIERYTIVISDDTQYRHTLDGKACRWTLNRVLPRLGLYRVEVVVHTELGASRTLRQIVTLRDYLIVSLGDSLASGEGVPDKPGLFDVHAQTDADDVTERRPVAWKDRS